MRGRRILRLSPTVCMLLSCVGAACADCSSGDFIAGGFQDRWAKGGAGENTMKMHAVRGTVSQRGTCKGCAKHWRVS